jgi:hypothetical protein
MSDMADGASLALNFHLDFITEYGFRALFDGEAMVLNRQGRESKTEEPFVALISVLGKSRETLETRCVQRSPYGGGYKVCLACNVGRI